MLHPPLPMSNAAPMPVRTSDTALSRLQRLKLVEGKAYREIAAQDEFLGIPPGTLCTIVKTGEVPNRWRERFGMQPRTQISPVAGAGVTPGALTLGSVVCPGKPGQPPCGRAYIPNHPARKRCYVCAPVRRRKSSRGAAENAE